MRSIKLSLALVFASPALSAAHTSLHAQTLPALSPQTAQPTLIAAIAPAIGLLPEAPSPIHMPISGAFAGIMAVPCDPGSSNVRPDASTQTKALPCLPPPTYSRFLDSPPPAPLSPAQKALLAVHDIRDPGNLVTIASTAAFVIGTNPHTAFGPGWSGFSRNLGYSLLQDATGEFFGTFLIPTNVHQDPRYRRMSHSSIPRRTLHALVASIITQHDNGSSMLNYANLLTNPICAEISNLYVPGISTNGPSTIARIMTGYATMPTENLIAEFLPDVAKHIHIRAIFVQHILNQMSNEPNVLP
jgi:hypothetical protein